MRTRTIPAALLALLTIISGCSNACENLCIRLADYAEECGFTVLESELTECLDLQKVAPDEDLEACQDFNDPVTVRREWSCDDMLVYWDNGGNDS